MAADQTPKPAAKRSGSMAHVTLGILFAMNLLNYIDRSILNGMLPLIKKDWGLSDEKLGFLVAAFTIVYMVAAPVFGWLGDRYSRKWIAGVGVAVWSVSTAAASLSRNFWQLFGLRTILGIGEASYGTTAPTIITDLYPQEKRSTALSIFALGVPIGILLGFMIGGRINDSLAEVRNDLEQMAAHDQTMNDISEGLVSPCLS